MFFSIYSVIIRNLMVSKNKVDDYYAGISVDESKNKSTSSAKKVKMNSAKKVKIKGKKKIVSKEKPKVKEDLKVSSTNLSSANSQPVKKSSLVQTIQVMQTNDAIEARPKASFVNSKISNTKNTT